VTDVQTPVVTVWHACEPAKHRECKKGSCTVTGHKPPEGTYTLLYELHPMRTDLAGNGEGDEWQVDWETVQGWPHQVSAV
jgi:hypothetical protein